MKKTTNNYIFMKKTINNYVFMKKTKTSSVGCRREVLVFLYIYYSYFILQYPALVILYIKEQKTASKTENY